MNPYTIELLAKHGHPVDGFNSKSWGVFEKPDAPRMDIIITVCDNAAGETCPLWPGKPVTAHWGFEDPAAFAGSHESKVAKFNDVYGQILARIRLMVSLPVESLDRLALETKLRSMGQSSHRA